jgi:hypothetical protein
MNWSLEGVAMFDCVGIVGVGLTGHAFSRHRTLRFKAEG